MGAACGRRRRGAAQPAAERQQDVDFIAVQHVGSFSVPARSLPSSSPAQDTILLPINAIDSPLSYVLCTHSPCAWGYPSTFGALLPSPPHPPLQLPRHTPSMRTPRDIRLTRLLSPQLRPRSTLFPRHKAVAENTQAVVGKVSKRDLVQRQKRPRTEPNET